jgi:hypothetical protein
VQHQTRGVTVHDISLATYHQNDGSAQRQGGQRLEAGIE